jgi:hypothetical protein
MIIKNQRTFCMFSCHSYCSLICIMHFIVCFEFYFGFLYEILGIEIKEYVMFCIFF